MAAHLKNPETVTGIKERDENAGFLPGPDDEADHVDGLGVTPLQVVDDQKARPVVNSQRPTHRIEQPIALCRVT